MKHLILSLHVILAATFLSAQPQSQPTYENLNATLWFQRAGESHALALQAFQAARGSLLIALKDPQWTAALEQELPYAQLPPAIILDLDETVLDNSPSAVQRILDGSQFTDAGWQKWVDQERATALPGAVEFLKFVRSHGVDIFYVTNRVCDPTNPADHTLAVLTKLQMPVNPRRLFCKSKTTDPSDKSPRRARISAAARVLLLLGDDLNDFVWVPAVEGGATERLDIRTRYVEANRDFWGTRWFILPNPTYGGWEKAAGFTNKEKLEVLRR